MLTPCTVYIAMQRDALQTLMVARTLMDHANRQCQVEDRYIASAGLLVLQDAIELVFYACFLELKAYELKAIEHFTFDELIGCLSSEGHKVIKSGTLKALNKQRVTIKHYGQLAEPETVKTFYNAGKLAIDDI